MEIAEFTAEANFCVGNPIETVEGQDAQNARVSVMVDDAVAEPSAATRGQMVRDYSDVSFVGAANFFRRTLRFPGFASCDPNLR